jgi:hypothetical protein
MRQSFSSADSRHEIPSDLRPESADFLRNERGLSIVEVVAASVISAIAVLGLAYSFGLGRANINRFEVARAAFAAAQARLEYLHSNPRSAFAFDMDSLHVRPFNHAGRQVGTETWTVTWYDDPLTPTANDIRKVTVRVGWTTGALSDTVTMSRLFYRI